MRVVSGQYGGRNLKAVPGINTRPTTDKIKESLFNIIGPYFDGGRMLDMYAGSGAIAIEAVSRGMDEALLFERNRQAIDTIKQNLAMTKEEEKFTLMTGDARKLIKIHQQDIKENPFSLVFLDPPYKAQDIEKDIQTLIELNLLTNQAIIVAEIDKSDQLAEEISQMEQYRRVEYGMTALVFYQWKEQD